MFPDSLSVLRSARQALHQQIATVLATQFPSVVDTQPERLAHHYTEAGHGAPAVGYWQRAGQRALDHAAPVAAITHLRRGLDVLATLPETTASLHHELALQVALGAAWTQTSGWAAPEVGQAYARARELGQSLGAFPQLFAALLGQCVRSMQMADLPAAHTVATHLFTLAQQHAEPVVRLAAHTTRGATLFYRGEVAAAHAQLTQASLLDVPPSHHALGVYHRFDLGVVARCYRAMSLWFLGTPDQAWRQMSQAYALAQELAQPYDLAFALIWMARLQQWRRDVPAILTSTECLVALTAEHGFGQYGSWARMLRGWALVAQGQGDEGLDQMRQGMTAYEALGATLSRPYYLALLAEGYSLMGAAETSLELLAEALAIMQHTEDRVWEAEIHRLQGLVRRQAHPSHTAPAEAAVQQALAVARRQQAKSLELRAAMSLSRLWQQQGKSAEARELLTPIYGWFTEGFDTADLQEAKALLEELEA